MWSEFIKTLLTTSTEQYYETNLRHVLHPKVHGGSEWTTGGATELKCSSEEGKKLISVVNLRDRLRLQIGNKKLLSFIADSSVAMFIQ